MARNEHNDILGSSSNRQKNSNCPNDTKDARAMIEKKRNYLTAASLCRCAKNLPFNLFHICRQRQ